MNCPPHLEAAYRRAAAANLPLLALLQGCIDRRHELAILNDPTKPWPARINKWLAPSVTLLGDDPWPARQSLGPPGWACAPGARRWAQGVVVHGTGPAFEHYRVAGMATGLCNRVLFVETDSAHIDEWVSFLGCPHTLTFRPPPGRVHPSQDGETRH